MEDFTITEWIIAGAILIFILAVLYWKFRKELKFLMKKSEAEGTIINWMAAVQAGKKVYYPMIEFDAPDKGRIAFRAEEMCEGEPMYPRGTKVKIIYLPEDPEVRKVIYPTI